MRTTLIQTVTIAWLWASAFCMPAGADLPPATTADRTLAALGMDRGQIDELARGATIAYDLDEGSDNELAIGIARFLPLPSSVVAERLQRHDLARFDADITALGELPGPGGAARFERFRLSRQEERALLDAAPGAEFNLSHPEIERFRSLKGQSADSHEAGQQYREILRHRLEAYRNGGIGAIAAYARPDGTDSSPSRELRQAAIETRLLTQTAPGLQAAWLNYPSSPARDWQETFLWVNKTVENRPTAILRHSMSGDWSGGVLMLTREFFVGHSYNSSQFLTGCLPWRDGTVIFQQVRSFTDQVTGVGSEVRHLVGREMLKAKTLQTFERLGDGLISQRGGE